jgi:LuxR family transcriptional regulator, maltose regulon positive regulatory protein
MDQGSALAPFIQGTKLHAPQPRRRAVRRPRLTEGLLGARPSLALVVAPPGFGKTTFLSDWAADDERRFAWLSLGRPDNDRTVLWMYIAAALAGNRRSSADRFLGLALEPDPVEAVLAAFAGSREIVLVLDDYHVIESEACHESVMRLVDSAPSHLQIVIASRTDPPMPIARRRASGDLIELGATDLAFTPEESEEFLNGSLRLGLDAEAVALLHERTEGWPAGLSLAYLSLRRARDPSGFIATFGASNRHVGDYLTEQVLGTLEPGERDFMLATSIVDEVCGPLADDLTGETGSSQRLVDLERANVFLTPLDDRREWYRYHHLLAELLRLELRRRAPQREADLHVRASRWFEKAGDADRAIRHAIDAGDGDRAARLISASYLQALEWGRLATIASWLERVGDERIARDARLAIVKAWIMHFLGNHAEGAAALAAARRSSFKGTLPDGASSIDASAALIGAAFPGGDVGQMLVNARRAFELESHLGSRWRTTVHVLLGFALVRNGLFDEADRYLEIGAELADRSSLWMDAVGARSLRSRVKVESGDPATAERHAREAVDLAQVHGVAPTATGAFATAVLGAILVEEDRAEEGAGYLAEAIPALRALGEPLPLAEALLAAARAHRALGQHREATRAFEEADALIEAMPDPGYLAVTRRSVASMVRRGPAARGDPLSAREVEVLQMLAIGLTKREVASQLFVSYNTVHSHVRAIYRKLGVGSRESAVARARADGTLETVEDSPG